MENKREMQKEPHVVWCSLALRTIVDRGLYRGTAISLEKCEGAWKVKTMWHCETHK